MTASAEGVQRHRREAPHRVPCAVITVSDTRRPETDAGGDLVAELLSQGGHPVVLRRIVKDDVAAIRSAFQEAASHAEVRAVLLTGGTGIAPRDVTPEALEPLLERAIPGFGELFRALSFQEIGAAALLSRAFAGVCSGRPVFALPGSRAAIRLALERLILPELGHMAGEGTKASLPASEG